MLVMLGRAGGWRLGGGAVGGAGCGGGVGVRRGDRLGW